MFIGYITSDGFTSLGIDAGIIVLLMADRMDKEVVRQAARIYIGKILRCVECIIGHT